MKRAGKPIGAASEKGCVLGDMTSVELSVTFKLRGVSLATIAGAIAPWITTRYRGM
jgi:hypothetical protein